jgi:hypothetical protein
VHGGVCVHPTAQHTQSTRRRQFNATTEGTPPLHGCPSTLWAAAESKGLTRHYGFALVYRYRSAHTIVALLECSGGAAQKWGESDKKYHTILSNRETASTSNSKFPTRVGHHPTSLVAMMEVDISGPRVPHLLLRSVTAGSSSSSSAALDYCTFDLDSSVAHRPTR